MGGSSSKQREEERRRKEEAERVRAAIEYSRLQTERRWREETALKQAIEYARLRAERKRREEEIARQAIEYSRRQAEMQRQKELQRRRLELQKLQYERVVAEQRRQQRLKANILFLRRLNKHKVTKNLELLNDFRKTFDLTPLSSYPDTPYTETELLKTSGEYIRTIVLFKTSNKPFFTVSKITRVDNTFHILLYKVMKDKYQNCYDESSLSEVFMFHGTKREFLDSICTYNFDLSKVLNHKFGHGISFARDSYFATHYHRDNKRNNRKVMIITQMFWGGLDQGTENMIVPSKPRYTSANSEKTVIVKYDEASFYPRYIVYYEGLHYTNMNLHDASYD